MPTRAVRTSGAPLRSEAELRATLSCPPAVAAKPRPRAASTQTTVARPSGLAACRTQVSGEEDEGGMLLLRGFPGARLFPDRGVIARVDGRVMSFLRSAWVVTGCSGGGEGEHPLHVPRHGHEAPLAAHPVQP